MGKGLRRSHGRGDPQHRPIIKQTYVAKDLAITVDGAAGVGFGTAVLGDFPEGNILFLGATSYLTFSGPVGDAGLVDTWEGDYGVGTIPMSDATIADGDEDIIAEQAILAASGEVSPRTRGTSLAGDTGEIHDNTDNSLEINVNLLVDDAHISADGIAFTADGEVTIAYIMMGDD